VHRAEAAQSSNTAQRSGCAVQVRLSTGEEPRFCHFSRDLILMYCADVCRLCVIHRPGHCWCIAAGLTASRHNSHVQGLPSHLMSRVRMHHFFASECTVAIALCRRPLRSTLSNTPCRVGFSGYRVQSSSKRLTFGSGKGRSHSLMRDCTEILHGGRGMQMPTPPSPASARTL
jgi:hypothetical protein